MKLAILIGGAAGYVLGTRAGRERYESIVRVRRRVVGSQTVQSAAGVLRARAEQASSQLRDRVTAKVGGSASRPAPDPSRNGVHAYR